MENLNFRNEFKDVESLLKLFIQNKSPATPKQFSIQTSKIKFCVYPGTFNPWHDGHSSCVELHGKYYPDIPLMVLPDQNPQKSLLEADLSSRLKNEKFNFKAVYLSNIFREKVQKNPTYKWLNYLKHHCPHLQLGLLLGLDSYLNLTKWMNYPLLLQSLSFLEIVPRNIKDLALDNPNQSSVIKAIAPDLKLNFIPENPFDSVSSTQLRQI